MRDIAGTVLERIDIERRKRKHESAARRARYGWGDVQCSECGDTGLAPETNQPCPICEQGARITQILKRGHDWREAMPMRYRDYTLESHPSLKIRQQVETWIGPDDPVITDAVIDDEAGPYERWAETSVLYRRPADNLVLVGDPGTGKTGIAIAAMRELYLRGFSVRFGSVPDIIDGWRPNGPASTRPFRAEGWPVATLERVDVLLLDDLGVERITDWAAERFQSLINGRYENEFPTIVTTNRTIPELRDLVGARVISRLMESATLIHADGPDLRLAPARREPAIHESERP
ncbi:MAG: ATP-binding protein [Thermomicrobiales bacterium]